MPPVSSQNNHASTSPSVPSPVSKETPKRSAKEVPSPNGLAQETGLKTQS